MKNYLFLHHLHLSCPYNIKPVQEQKKKKKSLLHNEEKNKHYLYIYIQRCLNVVVNKYKIAEWNTFVEISLPSGSRSKFHRGLGSLKQ